MATSIQDLIAGKQKDMAAKKSRQNTLKPAAGKHTYRILPSWRGGDDKQFWHDFSMHFIKTTESIKAGNKPAAVYICSSKTFDKPCEVCAAIEKMMAVSTDDDTTKQLKEAKSAQRYLMNVLHLTGDEPDKPQVMEVGTGVFEGVCNLIGEYGDITDLNEGIDLVITRSGTGLDTKYAVMPAAKSKPVNKSVMSGVTNLDEFVAQENPQGETKALTAVGAIAGILPSNNPALARPARGNAALAALSEADDADFEDITPTRGASSAVVDEDELSDLDDLLSDDN